MSHFSDNMSMERRNIYLFMGDEKIWKIVPAFKGKRSKEIKLRKEQRREEALYEINYPLRLQVRFPLVEFIMKEIVKYQPAMLAICHVSHAENFRLCFSGKIKGCYRQPEVNTTLQGSLHGCIVHQRYHKLCLIYALNYINFRVIKTH